MERWRQRVGVRSSKIPLAHNFVMTTANLYPMNPIYTWEWAGKQQLPLRNSLKASHAFDALAQKRHLTQTTFIPSKTKHDIQTGRRDQPHCLAAKQI